jgi:hypothetical protein
MTTFALPVLIDNVVVAFSGASSLSGVMIVDGPELNAVSEGEVIVVGHDGVPAGEIPAANSSNLYVTLGARRMNESGSLDCVIRSYPKTTTNLKTLRDRAYALLSAIDTIIRTDPTFSGSVQRCGLGKSNLSYAPVQQGFGIKLTFTIDYEAIT